VRGKSHSPEKKWSCLRPLDPINGKKTSGEWHGTTARLRWGFFRILSSSPKGNWMLPADTQYGTA
jgi:hypothetical protein